MWSQISSSVLSQGNWFRFAIDTTGVFRIDRSFLEQMGISLNGVNPRNIHIYGNGGRLLPEANNEFRYDDLQENAIYIEGENDGVFNNDDFILFYGIGPHSWEVNPVAETATHRQNIYSDKSYYFITINDTPGIRITNQAPISGNPVTTITTFDDYIFHEEELVNLFAAGRQWFGEDFSVQNRQSITIPFPKALVNEEVTIRVRAAASSVLSSSMQVSVNGNNLFSLGFPAITPPFLTQAFASQRSSNFVSNSDTFSVELIYNNQGNPSAKAYLDYIEFTGKKQLIADAFQFGFRSFESESNNNVIAYSIANASVIERVWDVTNPLEPSFVQNQSTGGNFTFLSNGGSLEEFAVETTSDYYIPELLENSVVLNQNLHALQDINYLIITNSDLQTQAQRLADYHINNSGLTTQVVLLDEIYNEFASGSKDITGIRDFIKHIYDSNTSEAGRLQFVCFFGDASYDYKDRIIGNNNIVPVYLAFTSFNLATSYVTDDYYVMLEDNEGSMDSNHTIDVATGRIPVTDVNQAREVVDKILSYYQSTSLGDWRNTITLIADDIDESGDIPIQRGVEEIADEIKNNKPVFNINKIYADAFPQQTSSGGERYPEVKNAISTAIEKGSLLVDYFGHGGEDGFASERFLDRPQVQGFVNENTLPLFITVTCDFSRFDNPSRTTAGELTFWNPRGGAANMITTTREVFIPVGQRFNEDLMRVLLQFSPNNYSIAQSLLVTKNQFSNFQKFFIYYFGDPAAKLAIPEPNIQLTRMNGVDVTQSLDTIKALSTINFEGVVTDNSNNVLNDFNGTLFATIFDKPIDKSTLDNDGFGVNLSFDSQESKLFNGRATISNGQFQFQFVAPKDIRVAYGEGKLSFYAENTNIDKSGFRNDIIVGGINENATQDNTGPQIQLYLNDESFIDGGNTNTSPNLIVQLSDENGINTSVTAIDHDIVAILDGDESNPIVLNDFYETELDDFTNGRVTYKLRDLSVGPHTLTLKAWDTHNNSSEASLQFVVVSDAILQLENVLNYPNPFVNYTEFWFRHNKPNEPLEVQVQIFTISGKLIKTINQIVQTTGSLSRDVNWNGLDDFGSKLGKGVYIYKLKVKSTVSDIVAEKYEKLVIL